LIAEDRISEYEIKLMDIDQEALGIPETEYDAKVTLSSAEFARICRDLLQLGESVRIEVSKEGVRFTSEGDAANGSILLRPAGDRVRTMGEASSSSKKVKKEKIKVEEDEDAQMADNNASEDDAGENDEEEEKNDDDDEEEESSSKKRKRSKKEEPKRKTKKTKKGDDDDDDEERGVLIAMSQHVNLTFSLKYLANFSKSGSLCSRVSLSMSNDVPLLVSRSLFPAPYDPALIYR
jgi:proliferating cell nuclear antigen